MKLTDYKCEVCGSVEEHLFNDTEEQPEVHTEECSSCGGKLVRDANLKNNCQRWKYHDQGGL